MFVLLDMEWIESRSGHRSLTQLYAARVDEKWNTIRAFDALVCPREPGNCAVGASGVQRLCSRRVLCIGFREKLRPAFLSLASAGRRDLLLAR